MFIVPLFDVCPCCEGLGFFAQGDSGPLAECALCDGKGRRPVPPEYCAALNGQQLLFVAPTYLQMMDALNRGLAEGIDVIVYRDNRVIAVRFAEGNALFLGTHSPEAA